ncbi:oligoendopeptidase F [Erysipelothrix larvae]|uniref:Oligopeptidase F n=1 Tax=Erysipelothrix larvae TaxID=1514105 RepID=A0A0X8GZW5_9FIRM|nr:oligoendopeptidase F [Erysipelothrix larvae]AMC93520.1 oligoendopeptidase F [Erysipelothrix larvae]
MTKTIYHRSQVDQNITWDLTAIFKTEADFEAAIPALIDAVDTLKSTYQGTLKNYDAIYNCLKDYEAIQKQMDHIFTYASLKSSEDSTDPVNQNRSSATMMKVSSIFPKLNFVEDELRKLDESVLNEVIAQDPHYARYLGLILKNKANTPSEDVVNALSVLKNTFDGPYDSYQMNKLVDMDFGTFEANGKTYPNSYGLFEDEWETDNDMNVRHAAFDSFYSTLAKHQNTVASVYSTHVLTEKALGQLSNFDNTIDSLLFDQEVTRDMYDRQIDLIMTHLAPHMRKYAKLLKRVHNLDTMTYKDLKLVVDPEFEPSITIEESKKYLNGALARFGDDYLEIVKRAFDERWIDFPQNKGKSTGAFCSTPYGVHPYVLISWTEKMNEVFVLAHELGHAGHFYLSGEAQTIINTRPSLYIIEAPSTMNELMMVDYLMNTVEDKRMKRWVLSTIIARTYYHNFVTHLLEAAYQREVYLRADNNEPINAHSLNAIKRQVLETFWGNDVEISENSELTWMRQPHYYMGLYPYTYSAGLTLATCANRKIANDELPIEKWKDLLKAGGTKNPIDLAKMVDVDLTTEQPLMQTIDYIGSIIDEIIALTDELENA